MDDDTRKRAADLAEQQVKRQYYQRPSEASRDSAQTLVSALKGKRLPKPSTEDEVAGLIDQDKADLVDALSLLLSYRHEFRPSTENEDVCAVCNENFRDRVHFRVGEYEKTDKDFARQALARHTPQEADDA